MLDDFDAIPMGSGDTINHHAHGATIPDLKFDALDAAREQWGRHAVLRITGMTEITSTKHGITSFVQVVCLSVPEGGAVELTNTVHDDDLVWIPEIDDPAWTEGPARAEDLPRCPGDQDGQADG